MPEFSQSSKERLATCHGDLQRLLNEAIKHYDFSVICGFRDQKAQNEAVATGASKLRWPNSRHNTFPSMAVDVAPYPINWRDPAEFYYLAGLIHGIATQMGIAIKWGGRFESIHDTPHIELV